jgi:hypothetical protein
MSYDFFFFKIKGRMPDEEGFCEDDMEIIGSLDEIKRELCCIFPDLYWQELALSDKPKYSFWQGVMCDEHTWYDFSVSATGKVIAHFSVRTSHRTLERKAIPEICSRLNLVAFDPQTGDVIKPNNSPDLGTS